MITIVIVCMVMHPAKPEVQEMGGNNQQHSRYQQPVFILDKELFQHKEDEPGKEKEQGQQVMMMFLITMEEGVTANTQRQDYHSHFKANMMDDIDTKKGQTA